MFALSQLQFPVALVVTDRGSRREDVVAVISKAASLHGLEETIHPPVASMTYCLRDAAGRFVDVTRESVEALLGVAISQAVMFARVRGPRPVNRAA